MEIWQPTVGVLFYYFKSELLHVLTNKIFWESALFGWFTRNRWHIQVMIIWVVLTTKLLKISWREHSKIARNKIILWPDNTVEVSLDASAWGDQYKENLLRSDQHAWWSSRHCHLGTKTMTILSDLIKRKSEEQGPKPHEFLQPNAKGDPSWMQKSTQVDFSQGNGAVWGV